MVNDISAGEAPLLRRQTLMQVGGSLLGVLVLVLVLSPLLSPDLQNGDSVVYNHQIERYELLKRTTHIGYYLLGMVFCTVSPLDTDTTMNLMCLVMGACGLLALHWLTVYHTGSQLLGVVAALLALTCRAYLRGMLLSEVDVVHTSLVLIALALFQLRPVTAGLCYGSAMLVSPLAALMLPAFVLSIQWTHGAARQSIVSHLKRVTRFGFSASLVYLPVVACVAKDYLWGYRGLLTAPREPLDPIAGLQLSVRFVSEQGPALLPLILAGLALAMIDWYHRERGFLALGVLVAMAISALVGERFGGRVPVQLPGYVVLCTFPAMLGTFLRVPRHWWLVPAAAFLVVAPGSLSWVMGELEEAQQLRATHLAMQEMSFPREVVFAGVGNWHTRMLFDRHVYGKPYSQRSMSWKELDRRVQELLDTPDDLEIWVNGTISPRRLERLSPRYRLTERQLAGKTYQVLIPRAISLSQALITRYRLPKV